MSTFSSTINKPAKYLVCVDNREESHAALRLACMKARVRNGSVEMLHIIPPADFQTLGMIADRMREERHNEAQELLDSLSTMAQENYGVTPVQCLREGPIGDEIVSVAMDDNDITMIVIGTAQQHSGRGSLAGWLASQLGSKLLIPLLLVPGNLTDFQLENLV
ncbi:MAG: universal stress protein [Alphaproteobacteria bacterium]|nr:universal stress protein [Alphaproteobacteria bacterium]